MKISSLPRLHAQRYFGGAWLAICVTSVSSAADAAVSETALHVHATSAGEVPMRSVLSSFRPGFEVRALQDDSNVSFRWGTPIANKHQFIALTASAPIDKDADSTSAATLDGFSKAVTFELKSNWFWGDDPGVKEDADKARLAGRGATAANPNSRYHKLNERVDRLRAAQSGAPQQRASDDSINTAEVDTFKRTNVLSFSATLGQQDFDYLETGTLTEKSTNKALYSGRVSFAKYVLTDSAFALDFEYQDIFEAAANKSFALPVGANGLQEVKSGAYGAPDKTLKRLYSVEFRKRLQYFAAKNGGIAIKLTYDQVGDVFGVRVPIYFIQDDGENATGGVEFGWVDHKDKTRAKFTVGLMIGAGLKLGPF